MSTEAMKQALEALKRTEAFLSSMAMDHLSVYGEVENAIAAIEQAENNTTTHSEECWRWHHGCAVAKIEQAEKQEPVAWLFTNLQSGDYDFCYHEDEHDHDREMWHKQPLYTAPPQREPVADEKGYTTTRNSWTGKETHKCKRCGRDDFATEHSAKFHSCENPHQNSAAERLAHVLPGGKHTDECESARVTDYNAGWNDYRKAAKSALEKLEVEAPPQREPLTDEQRAVLWEVREKAMKWTVQARMPECAMFGAIAQDLDWLCGQHGIKGGA